MQRKFLSVVSVLMLSIMASGCARNIDSNVYSAASVGEASFSYQGYIVSSRKVTVQEHEKLEDNTMGIGLGGLTGGLLGSQVGGGSGKLVGVGAGALIGGVAGAFAEKALKTQEAFEYVVKLTNGQLMTVVQGLDAVYQSGQRVMVIVSHDGRSRLVPDSSPIQDAQAQAPAPVPSVKINKKR